MWLGGYRFAFVIVFISSNNMGKVLKLHHFDLICKMSS